MMGEKSGRDNPGDMLGPHPVKPLGMYLRRYEAGDIIYIHGAFLGG
jgi:hypothetical protein